MSKEMGPSPDDMGIKPEKQELDPETESEIDIINSAVKQIESGQNTDNPEQVLDGISIMKLDQAPPTVLTTRQRDSAEVATFKEKAAGLLGDLKDAFTGGPKGREIFKEFGGDISSAYKQLSHGEKESLWADLKDVSLRISNKWGVLRAIDNMRGKTPKTE
ncbi:hypothetical protein KKF61_02200 [Patescibacteria group bacterium]|nr:hypothetical protein [Patescibacteria group bacterium]MBU0963832.1 hypothetical protein [Patescibacteria group bacterium]